MEYQELKVGDTLQPEDEYYNDTKWKIILPFMVGDKITSTDGIKWRRPLKKRVIDVPSEYWVITSIKYFFKDLFSGKLWS